MLSSYLVSFTHLCWRGIPSAYRSLLLFPRYAPAWSRAAIPTHLPLPRQHCSV